MGRHSPKGQIVLKKTEKLAAVAASLSPDCTDEAFGAKFKEMYAADWQKIVQRHSQHERNSADKKHPMPAPDKYVLNMVKIYRAKAAKSG